MRELTQLSIEELANIPVTTVLRRPVPIGEAPSAVFVITDDDIRRTDVRSVPEALRLAPNLDVAQVDAASYAVSARGFGGVPSAANKILALVDGRTVYSPLFSGVFWHENNLLMADIDRIEVISGPGGTLWGANAFNGVVNVITKSSADTQGLYADAAGGGLDQQLGLQYGGRIGERLTYRVYGMGLWRGHTLTPAGARQTDAWRSGQGGFRLDWDGQADTVTVQGDAYDTSVERGDRNRGQNLLVRWRRTLDDASSLMLRAYVDRAPSSGQGVAYSVTTGDLLAQYNRTAGAHQLVLGGGYRRIHDRYDALAARPPFILRPASADVDLANLFAQDSIDLTGALQLTLGTKLEYSSYTGSVLLPNLRLGWRVSDSDYLWAAVSRAARTASRFDRDFVISPVLLGGPDFTSEKVIAYEAGYRGRPTAATMLSVSAYYNVYDDLRSVELTNGGLPAVIANGVEGRNYGVEAWADYQLAPRVLLSAGASVMHGSFHASAGRQDLAGLQSVGDSPNYQGSLRSQIDFGHGLSLDFRLRGVGRRRTPAVPGYVEADASLNWRIRPGVELQLTGDNLLHDSHVEGVLSGVQNRIRRSVFANLRLEL